MKAQKFLMLCEAETKYVVVEYYGSGQNFYDSGLKVHPDYSIKKFSDIPSYTYDKARNIADLLNERISGTKYHVEPLQSFINIFSESEYDSSDIDLSAKEYRGIKEDENPYFKMSGYKPLTNYWNEFTKAENSGGKSAVKSLYPKLFSSAKSDYKKLTELCMVLNNKSWYWYDKDELDIAKVYDSLWKECDKYCCENLKGEEAKYFFKTTD